MSRPATSISYTPKCDDSHVPRPRRGPRCAGKRCGCRSLSLRVPFPQSARCGTGCAVLVVLVRIFRAREARPMLCRQATWLPLAFFEGPFPQSARCGTGCAVLVVLVRIFRARGAARAVQASDAVAARFRAGPIPGCSIIRTSLSVVLMVSLPCSGSLWPLCGQVPTGHTLPCAPSLRSLWHKFIFLNTESGNTPAR